MAQFEVETVALDTLQPHPLNYRAHPEEQVEAIAASLQQFGQYRPIVVSSDGYILAGEGVWRGRKKAGCADIDAVRMPFAHDDPRAEKLLVADNELSRLAEDDDKQLAALLASIERQESGLAGTGWNDSELDALIAEMAAEGSGAGEQPERQTLAEQWGAPPFSVLDARQGYWQERKRQWLSLGIRSEIGRGGANTGQFAAGDGTGPELLPQPRRGGVAQTQ